MKTANLLLTAAIVAAAVSAASAAPSSTDEARDQAAQRIAIAAHAASLRPDGSVGAEVIRVTDTDSARQAAEQANAHQAHDSYLSEVRRAGIGVRPAPIRVTDTDSARAAAAQDGREQQLLADYSDYVNTQARATLEPGNTSNR